MKIAKLSIFFFTPKNIPEDTVKDARIDDDKILTKFTMKNVNKIKKNIKIRRRRRFHLKR